MVYILIITWMLFIKSGAHFYIFAAWRNLQKVWCRDQTRLDMRATCSAMSMCPRSKFLQNTSNEDKVVGFLWGYWSIEAGSCVDILCRQLDTTRDVDLRLPMATCHQKDHTRSTWHGDWVRSLESLELADFAYPHGPCPHVLVLPQRI